MRILPGAGLRKAAGWYGHPACVYDAAGTEIIFPRPKNMPPAYFLTAFRVPSQQKKADTQKGIKFRKFSFYPHPYRMRLE